MTSRTPPGQDPASAPARAAQRREMTTVLGLAALAGLVILFTGSRSWLSVTVGRRPPFGPLPVELTGRAEYPALTALAAVALLAVVLVLVSGGVVRRVLGGLLVLAGGWSCWYAAQGLSRPSPARLAELLGDRLSQSTGLTRLERHLLWPVSTLVAAGLLALCGLAVAARAGRWQLGLSARYAAPATAAESGDPWRQLDRGEDPTAADR